MARMTRSHKIAIAEDDNSLLVDTSTGHHSQQTNKALVEANLAMAINTVTTTCMEDAMHAAQVKGLKAAYKSALGVGKKIRRGKGKRKDKQTDSQETLVEDEVPAPELASASPSPDILALSNSKDTTSITAESQSMSQPAIRTTCHLANAQAAKDGLEKPNAEMGGNGMVCKSSEPLTGEEVSFHQEGKENHASRTPAGSPVKTLEDIERIYGSEESETLADDTGDDSFVQQITSRSPAKRLSRIEDSVEALDQLEEALEALDQATLAESMASSERSRQNPRLIRDSPRGSEKLGKQEVKEQTSRPGNATMRAKPVPKQAPSLKKAASMTFKPASHSSKPNYDQRQVQSATKPIAKRPASLGQPKETLKSTKAPTRPTFELPGEAVAQKLKEQREARLAQRQTSEDSSHTARIVSGPKIKSTKAPTKSSFRLPGEEVSQRKRATHDARLKAQEEEERKRREFKARPIRNSVVPSMVPRDTVASRARTTKVGIDDIEDGNFSVSKRGSNVGAHRPSIPHLALANSSAPRAKGTYIPPVRKPSPIIPESSRPLQRAVSVTNSTLRKRAKEIYNRDAVLTAEMEKEKRDREAAAKRAREEAAERGRQASREWAEKQMARKMAESDK